MKRYFISIILTLICTLAQAQTIFDRYADTNGVSTVYISKTMLSMIPDMKASGVNIGSIASKLDNIRILTCEKAELLPRLRKETASIGKDYDQLMKVTDNGDNIDIYMKHLKGGKNEYLIRVSEKSGLTVILISGSVTPADIQSLVMNNKSNE